MTDRAPLLMLAGTREARLLADKLAENSRWQVTASLAGVTTAPAELPVETRIGGFGGIEGLVRYLEDNQIAAVVDATHSFAGRMSANAVAACARVGVPLLRVERPAWTPLPDAVWVDAQDATEAAALLPSGARAFLTVGSNSMEPFRTRDDVWYLIRTLEALTGDFPFAQGVFVHGMPGQKVDDESVLMDQHRITHLVTKNAGGPAFAKVEAAAGLQIQTVMIARPHLPPAETVVDVEGALHWLGQR